ncbi:MAG: hypothetical protein ABEJ58_09825 [Halodesulfurarchaeum sp.]
MTLERTRFEGHGEIRNRLVQCPFCGHDFDDQEPPWLHFLENHGPEDAGLSPIGEGALDSSPLFDPIEESDREVSP